MIMNHWTARNIWMSVISFLKVNYIINAWWETEPAHLWSKVNLLHEVGRWGIGLFYLLPCLHCPSREEQRGTERKRKCDGRRIILNGQQSWRSRGWHITEASGGVLLDLVRGVQQTEIHSYMYDVVNLPVGMFIQTSTKTNGAYFRINTRETIPLIWSCRAVFISWICAGF